MIEGVGEIQVLDVPVHFIWRFFLSFVPIAIYTSTSTFIFLNLCIVNTEFRIQLSSSSRKC